MFSCISLTLFLNTTSSVYGNMSLSLQISCLSASAALNDRTRYKRYFQLLPSYDTLAHIYFGVIKEYGWKHVELIVQDENLFTVVNQIHRDIEKLHLFNLSKFS